MIKTSESKETGATARIFSELVEKQKRQKLQDFKNTLWGVVNSNYYLRVVGAQEGGTNKRGGLKSWEIKKPWPIFPIEFQIGIPERVFKS